MGIYIRQVTLFLNNKLQGGKKNGEGTYSLKKLKRYINQLQCEGPYVDPEF